jgi:hypothetical protein
MSGILNSGKIATILTRVTAARATLWDNLSKLDATISTLLSTGGYTVARAGKLDNLDAAVSTAALAPPITSGLKGCIVSNSGLADVNVPSVSGLAISASTSTFDVWTAILNVTSSVGYVELLTAYQVANASDRDAQLRLTVDGNVVYTSDADLWKLAAENGDGVNLVGVVSGGVGQKFVAFGQMRFTDSLLLEFKKTENAAGTVEIGSVARYYLTG